MYQYYNDEILAEELFARTPETTIPGRPCKEPRALPCNMVMIEPLCLRSLLLHRAVEDHNFAPKTDKSSNAIHTYEA